MPRQARGAGKASAVRCCFRHGQTNLSLCPSTRNLRLVVPRTFGAEAQLCWLGNGTACSRRSWGGSRCEGSARLFGLMIATCVLGCELGKPPTAAAPKVVRRVAETPIDSRALLRASLTCMMAPILHDSWQRADDTTSAFDAEATSCFAAARAVEVRPVRLYRLDADATLEVRRVILQNRGDVYSSTEVNEMISVFDLGLAAVAEGRHAHSVLARKAPDSPDRRRRQDSRTPHGRCTRRLRTHFRQRDGGRGQGDRCAHRGQ